MDSAVDGRGARLDLVVRSESDMPPLMLELTNDDGTPVDLTNYMVVSTCTSRSGAPVRIVLGATVPAPATGGVVTLTLARAEIAKMPQPANVSSPVKVGADWSLALEAGDGTVQPLLYGEIRVGGAPVPL